MSVLKETYGRLYTVTQSNEPELLPEYHMACTIHNSIPVKEPEEWELDFYSIVKDNIPAPCIYKGKKCFQGGLSPAGAPVIDFLEERIIFSPSFGYKVVSIFDIKPVTNEIYFKYYKPLYISNYAKCNSGGCKSTNAARNYISLGKKHYTNFIGEVNDKT